VTPREFLDFQAEQRKVIRGIERNIEQARRSADRCKPPERRRPAKASDIRFGRVIWHANGDNGWFWNVVVEPLHYGDPFKAYCADDGCRYGLDGAFVEMEQRRKVLP